MNQGQRTPGVTVTDGRRRHGYAASFETVFV